MAVFFFVAFWVVLGAGLLFIGLSGGPRGARERMQTQSRRGRRGAGLVFTVLLVAFGVAVPAAVIAAVEDRDTVSESGVQLSAAQESGRQLFGQRCGYCHTLGAANASARVGPNLDTLRPPQALVLDAIRNGRARGNGNMAAAIVEGSEAREVASFIQAVAGK